MRHANSDAEKNLVHIGTGANGGKRRNARDVVVRQKGCIVVLKAISEGTKGNYLSRRICEAFGVDGMSVKIIGPKSKNLGTRAKTVFKAVVEAAQSDPGAQALAMGRMSFNANKVWRRRDYESIY